VGNSGLFLSPLKDILLWMELNSNKRIIFSLNTRKILQVVAIIVVGQRIPKLIHSIPKYRLFWRRKGVFVILSKVGRSHAVVVEVDCNFLLSNLSDNIWRSLGMNIS
jgi:hypothetical protein